MGSAHAPATARISRQKYKRESNSAHNDGKKVVAFEVGNSVFLFAIPTLMFLKDNKCECCVRTVIVLP